MGSCSTHKNKINSKRNSKDNNKTEPQNAIRAISALEHENLNNKYNSDNDTNKVNKDKEPQSKIRESDIINVNVNVKQEFIIKTQDKENEKSGKEVNNFRSIKSNMSNNSNLENIEIKIKHKSNPQSPEVNKQVSTYQTEDKVKKDNENNNKNNNEIDIDKADENDENKDLSIIKLLTNLLDHLVNQSPNKKAIHSEQVQASLQILNNLKTKPSKPSRQNLDQIADENEVVIIKKKY